MTQTEISDSTGPVHSGIGNQFNFLPEDLHRLLARALEARWIAKDDVTWLKRRFRPPLRLGDAREQLTGEARTVLLDGNPGSGRRSAALMLLRGLAGTDGTFKELPDIPDHPGERVLDSGLVDEGDRLLLDLSHSDENAFRARLAELSSFRTAVLDREAYLVVVLPAEHRQWVPPEFSRLVVPIERPNGRQVLLAHLRAENIELDEPDLSAKELAQLLDTGSMGDIAELARFTSQAGEEDPGGTVSGWLHRAHSMVIARGGKAAEQVRDLASGRERALVLVAAMLPGASADAVFHAREELLGEVEHTQDEKPRFEQEDFAQQLAKLGIKVDGDKRIGFDTIAYDHAVRTYFWDNFPGLRTKFAQWVGRAIRLPMLTEREREGLAGRFVEQALRTDQADTLLDTVEDWVAPEANRGPAPLLRPGVEALVIGLDDERHGGLFRRLVYDWSREADLPDYLGQVLVQVCTEVISRNYPDQALVRLHHRARREPDGAPAAKQALGELVRADRRLLRRLLHRLAEGHPKYEADLDLFLDLADPRQLVDSATRSQPLVADAGVRAQLAEVWQAVLSSRPHQAWSAHLRTWLRAAADLPRSEQLLDVLVDAAGGRLELLGRFHVIARDWAHAEPARTGVTEALARKIDAAQDLHPDDFELDLTTEETFR